MKKQGFTILEILIVVSVIAILLAVVSPRVKGMQDEANIAKARGELKTLMAAVESYKNNHSSALPANIGAALVSASPQLISATLSDPFQTAGAGYTYLTGGVFYVISSWGINGSNDVPALDSDTGAVTSIGDDLCITNGTGC